MGHHPKFVSLVKQWNPATQLSKQLGANMTTAQPLGVKASSPVFGEDLMKVWLGFSKFLV